MSLFSEYRAKFKIACNCGQPVVVRAFVDGMDMAEFHAMLSSVMAEHLGAIQVLGYVLGSIAGALLVIS